MDYESWRCKHDDKIFCPVEGCPKYVRSPHSSEWMIYGCARDHGWTPDQPSPKACTHNILDQEQS